MAENASGGPGTRTSDSDAIRKRRRKLRAKKVLWADIREQRRAMKNDSLSYAVSAPPPLEINRVVIETKEEYTTEAREKLKADNAIFYISYKCTSHDPNAGHLVGDYKGVIRRTMDGQPQHMCIEVAN